ncbi:HNH endonuclease [Azorhizobium sp. AG788]|nr:HNH endonuclease [Azorhizobium sp. AG788]
MSVLDDLSESVDPVDRELARTLQVWLNVKSLLGRKRTLGYEPRDIRAHGAVEVISRRIINGSGGFNEVPPKDSYESIVDRYPDRFPEHVVKIARERLEAEKSAFQPTLDDSVLEDRVRTLLSRSFQDVPDGIREPKVSTSVSNVFLRDPKVKAFVLRCANGVCECCGCNAPFTTVEGMPFLEVHHVRHLADGGSDTVSNTVALCPNCHRAMHCAGDASDRKASLYRKIPRLVIE